MRANNKVGFRGRILTPLQGPLSRVRSLEIDDGLILVEDGIIVGVETLSGAGDLASWSWQGWDLFDFGPDKLILPGFIDCHVHYPQTDIIAAYGETLLDWLKHYTFPAESAFADPARCRETAEFFFRECFRHGTTSMASYCTVHEASVTAFFEAASKYNARALGGKVLMDRNAPDCLTENVEEGAEETERLIATWHGARRLGYVISPRFAPTSTPQQLKRVQSLIGAHADVLVQTHLSETVDEVAWVRQLFPDCRSYTEVYDRFGILTPNTILGHVIYAEDDELALLEARGCAIAHCPTSNSFLGSGLFRLTKLMNEYPGIDIGLATDVGGGSSFSMLATMGEAYKVARLTGLSVNPEQLLYLATLGSAKALRIDRHVGSIEAGKEADFAVFNLQSTELISRRLRDIDSIWEKLFLHMILGDDRSICTTIVDGRVVHEHGFSARRIKAAGGPAL